MDSMTSSTPTLCRNDKSTEDVSIDEGVVDQQVVDHVVNEISRALSTLLNIDNDTNATIATSTYSMEAPIQIQSSGDANNDSNISTRSSFDGHSQYRNESSSYDALRRRTRRNNATAHHQFNGGQINVQCNHLYNYQYNNSLFQPMQLPLFNLHHGMRPFFYQPPVALPPTRPPPVLPPLHDQYLYSSSSPVHNDMNYMTMMHLSHNDHPFLPPTTSNNYMISRTHQPIPPLARPGNNQGYSTYNHGGHGLLFRGSPNHHQFSRPINRRNSFMNDLSDEVKIRKQIEYYFCDENLAKDDYLKGLMDKEGWVSVRLIAPFNMIRAITKDISLILKSLECSNVIELNGEYMRNRHNWRTWIRNHP